MVLVGLAVELGRVEGSLQMIQCKDCEWAVIGANGQVSMRCNPFATIKEAECLQKWQLLRLDAMLQVYQAQLASYRRMAPLQEKMMKFMEREMDDISESDKWKVDYDDDLSDDSENDGEERDDERPFDKYDL